MIQPPADSTSSGNGQFASKDAAIEAVINEALGRRARGEEIADEQLIAAHPELLPELGQRLAVRNFIHRQVLEGERAGQVAHPLEIISPSRIDEPLDLPQFEKPPPARALSIKGYRILHEISSGGQATVFLGVHETTKRKVAIKVLAGGPFIGGKSKVRFEREVKALATLAHPAIVGIIDRGRAEDGSYFLVLDYIEGEGFEDHLDRRKQGGAGVEDIVRLFVPIAEAIGEAHRNNIVHRDLKPSNLRVDSHGHPHVLDFGLARLKTWEENFVHSRITVTGNVIGSLPWASPEQASGDLRIHPQSDVYSLGMVMYKALAGQHAYPLGETMQAMTRNVCKVVPKPLERLKRPPFGHISPVLSDIVLKCLHKKPQHRYANGDELALDLKRYLDGKPTAAGKDREAHPLLKKVALALVTCALLVLLLSRGPNSSELNTGGLRSFVDESEIEFIEIPAGEFRMGSHPNDGDREDDEDYHRVFISRAFGMSRTEITRKQYLQVMGRLPAQDSDAGPMLPVTFVSWEEANEFCSRLSAKYGRRYRLPTEAEWEYACRAGTSGQYGGTGKLDEMGWYASNSGGTIQPVGRKRANHWGLLDMHGNASEWCQDGYVHHLGLRDREDPFTSPLGGNQVVRGGQFDQSGMLCRSAKRRSCIATFQDGGIGFRVVMELSPESTAASRSKIP